jgi:hypothetical protein
MQNDIALHRSLPPTCEAGHGRIGRRKVWATDQLDWFTAKQRTESVAVVESPRKLPGKTKQFRRYYLSSPVTQPQGIGRLIRNHWAIEKGSTGAWTWASTKIRAASEPTTATKISPPSVESR